MAKTKKKIEPIKGPGKEPETKLTVQKSLPLFSLWRSDMSLSEFKILDTYLSRINSHEPEKRTVSFTKGELEQLLGVTKINKADLSERLNGLGRFVEIEGADDKIHKVGLFEEVIGEIDENGQWSIQLTCTTKAMKYIFNIEKLGYLRYKLRCITSMTSRYTYVLFMYLESNRFRKSWVVGVDELRQILNCEQDELYKEFKRLNERILKRCQKELLEKTECKFSYEPIKTGKRVTGVKFTLETLADNIEPALPGQLSLDDFPEVQERPNELFASVLPEELTDEQIEHLRSLAADYVPWELGDTRESRDLQIANLLIRKVKLMEAQRTPVKHPYNWLKRAIEEDWN